MADKKTWIDFTETPLSKGATKTFNIVAKENGAILGHIKWYSAWRKYCFWSIPGSVTVFETDCLTAIISFLNGLNVAHKAELQQRKQNQL